MVKFPKEDLVECVPTKWLFDSGTKCYWPPKGKVEVSRKKLEDPSSSTWSVEPCVLIESNCKLQSNWNWAFQRDKYFEVIIRFATVVQIQMN